MSLSFFHLEVSSHFACIFHLLETFFIHSSAMELLQQGIAISLVWLCNKSRWLFETISGYEEEIMPESVLHNGDPTLLPHAEHTARDAGCIWLTSTDALYNQAGSDLQIALFAVNHLVGTSVHAHT